MYNKNIPNKYKMSQQLTVTNNQTQPLRMTSEMVESAWHRGKENKKKTWTSSLKDPKKKILCGFQQDMLK